MLKCDDIIFPALIVQLLQFGFKRFPGFLHLFHRITRSFFQSCLFNGDFEIIDLLLDGGDLPFSGERDLFKLRVADDDCIVISRRYARAELFAVCRLKVLFGGNQDVRPRVEAHEVAAPLFCKMIWHDIQALLCQAKPFTLHAGCNHLKCLARADTMGQERIVAVKDVRHSVLLVLHQSDFRRHPDKADMRAVILSRSYAVEKLIICPT